MLLTKPTERQRYLDYLANVQLELKNLGKFPRGGYYTTPDYPGTTIQYEYWHSVFVMQGDGFMEARTKTSLNNWDGLMLSYATIVADKFKLCCPDKTLGEICVRVIWYPAQEITSDMTHLDRCYLTVPLFDSLTPIGPSPKPFYGEMAHHFGKEGLLHRFQANRDCPRVYMVAFCQLPFATQLSNGRNYAEVLSELCGQPGRYQA